MASASSQTPFQVEIGTLDFVGSGFLQELELLSVWFYQLHLPGVGREKPGGKKAPRGWDRVVGKGAKPPTGS